MYDIQDVTRSAPRRDGCLLHGHDVLLSMLHLRATVDTSTQEPFNRSTSRQGYLANAHMPSVLSIWQCRKAGLGISFQQKQKTASLFQFCTYHERKDDKLTCKHHTTYKGKMTLCLESPRGRN